MGASYGTFYGDSIHFLLKNRSLHSIPIVKVFLLKRIEGQFYQILLKDYGDDPFVIDSWHIKRIETDPFSTILNYPSDDKRNWSELHKDAALGVDVGDGIIWVKPYKHAPLKEAKKVYRELSFQPLSVVRNSVDGVIVSNAIDYIIRVLVTDRNKNISQKTVFAIVGEKQTLLSDHIGPHNAIPSNCCDSPVSLKKYLCETYKIPIESIDVEKFRGKVK